MPLFFPGTRVGPYTLTREIGKGTFGVVWLAERRGRLATTRVALKFPVGLNEMDRQILIRESEIWSRATGHPNVMPVIEAEEYDGSIVIVTEYAQEGSLERWLERNGNRAPNLESALLMTTGILNGLAYLHLRGVLHRDLKPGNILLQGGSPRITDFGLARLSTTAMHSFSIAGTPEYMAPEAWRGNRSAQTDLWAVGILCYEMLTGSLPFPCDNWEVMRRAVASCEPAPLPESLPASVRHTVLTALCKNPADRFSSAEEMLASLQHPALPSARLAAATMTTGLGSIQNQLRDLDQLMHALENFTTQQDNPFYIGHTLVKCSSFLDDQEEARPLEMLVEEMLGKVESAENGQLPASERMISLIQVREVVRHLKQMKRDYLTRARHMTATAHYDEVPAPANPS